MTESFEFRVTRLLRLLQYWKTSNGMDPQQSTANIKSISTDFVAFAIDSNCLQPKKEPPPGSKIGEAIAAKAVCPCNNYTGLRPFN